MLLRKHTWVIVALQSLLILAALVLAWLLRFEFSLPHRHVLWQAAPVLLAARLIAMRRYNLFHGYWRYTGVGDALDIAKAVVLGSLVFLLVFRGLLGVKAFPISIYLLEAVLTGMGLAGIRVLSRTVLLALEQRHRENVRKRVMIAGAGAAAEALIRELLLNRPEYHVIGCVDDDSAKKGARLHGVEVLGPIDDLPRLAREHHVGEIFIAMPSVTGSRMRRVIEHCQSTGKKFKTIPGMRDLIEGRVTVGQLREVDVEDLLGREPVHLDLQAVRRHLAGQVVLVTGAAGSIGSELCRQILSYEPAKLICLDQAETPLFFLQAQLEQLKPQGRVVYCVADVTNGTRVRAVLDQYGVQIIFHAAAYKHVPMMEANVHEAVRNNIFGLLTLLRAAEDAGCERFLLISTDKAVNPTSVMGCTKRVGELILASRPSKMRCVAVRFGNVLGSQGSVIPVFQQQIRKQRRVTVTHPEITRYFMTIPEAISLVLQAFTIGEHGNVLVLDMGEAMRIVDLAKTLIKLSGETEAAVPIVFTGLRPGEKLYEELFYESEELLPTSHEKVNRTLSELVQWSSLMRHLEELQRLGPDSTDASLHAKLADIVPEYQHACAAPSRRAPARPGIEIITAHEMNPVLAPPVGD